MSGSSEPRCALRLCLLQCCASLQSMARMGDSQSKRCILSQEPATNAEAHRRANNWYLRTHRESWRRRLIPKGKVQWRLWQRIHCTTGCHYHCVSSVRGSHTVGQVAADVRYGSLADTRARLSDVRFPLESGHDQRRHEFPLSAISGHRAQPEGG